MKSLLESLRSIDRDKYKSSHADARSSLLDALEKNEGSHADARSGELRTQTHAEDSPLPELRTQTHAATVEMTGHAGGVARSLKLTQEQRSESARKAAQARYAKPKIDRVERFKQRLAADRERQEQAKREIGFKPRIVS